MNVLNIARNSANPLTCTIKERKEKRKIYIKSPAQKLREWYHEDESGTKKPIVYT